MPRVRIAAEAAEPAPVEVEIARLRDLDVTGLRACWENVFGKRAPTNLPRHLLFRMLAYRLQAERLGDLDAESRRILDRSASPEEASDRAAEANKRTNRLRPGTILGREWNGHIHRVAVLTDGFVWNGVTYPVS